MSFTKQFSQTIDLEKDQYAAGDPVVMNILDKEVYSVEITVQRGGVA